tara:strand:- start:2964 stop:4394 length:1431 start_codon:yes stop_codon:yes gene_type:complete
MLVLIVFSQDTSALQADFNNDCKVNLDDFLLFSKAFIAFQNQGILNSEFDLDNDNEVEIKDFFLFADSYYGAECGALEEGICPKGFILDDEISPLTKQRVCKPILMNLVASDDLDDYLGNRLPGVERVWDDWQNYPPLVKKVEELTEGKDSDFEKVKAIANWVFRSKNYQCPELYEDCRSPANKDKDFSVIFDSDEGVCLDAATITSAMLRAAEIPSIPRLVSINHIVTMYHIDGLWYSVDTTFCFDTTDCPDLVFMTPEEAKKRIYFLYNRIGHFNKEGIWDAGDNCEDDFCMDHPFGTNKIMPLNDKSSQATVIYPSTRVIVTKDPSTQIRCSLEFRNMICGVDGCFFSNIYRDKWDTVIRMQYEIEDMRNVGYNKIVVPAKAKFKSSVLGIEPGEIETFEEDRTINYRFACKEIVPDYRLIAYKEFILKPNDKRVITYGDLKRGNDATAREFNEVKRKIKYSGEDLGIDPEKF